MSTARSTRHRADEGQALVEFALVAPVLLLVVFSIIQFGILFGRHLELQSATREGARKASIVYDHADPVAEARAAVLDALAINKAADVTVSVSPPPSPEWKHGQEITIRSSAPTRVSIMGVVAWNGTLHSEAQVRVE